MTLGESFQELVRRIQPLDRELQAARRHISTIKSILEKEFHVSSCRTIGSFARETSIRGFSDTDLLAVFRKAEFTWGGTLINSNRALDNVRGAILDRYPDIDIRRDGIAIAIGFSDGRKVEIVPGMFQRMYREKWPIYLIPDGGGEWMPTCPSLYDSFVSSGNRDAQGKLITVAQMMKFWRECRSPRIPLSSFHIEMVLASERVCRGVKSYGSCVLDILRNLSNRECRAMHDPYDIAGNIPAVKTANQRERSLASILHSRDHASSALSAVARGDINEARRQWDIVFGGNFPW